MSLFSSSNAITPPYSQINTQNDHAQPRAMAMAQMTTLPASQGQSQAVETTARTNRTASYNLPSPSPTYPRGPINSYPGNASAGSMARTNAVQSTRTHQPSTSKSSVKQPFYPQTMYYGDSLQGRAVSRMSPKQMMKTRTPTPPVPTIGIATPATRTNTHGHKSVYQQQQQSATNTQTQNARSTRTRAQPSYASAVKQASVNTIMPSVGQLEASPKRAPSGHRDIDQPQQTSAATHAARIENLRSGSNRASVICQNQQQAQSRTEPAQDQPTSVGDSLMYNHYHEDQQQIEEAEAEAAGLAKNQEEKKAAGYAEKHKAEAANLHGEAEKARIRKQKKAKVAKAAREAKTTEKERQNQEVEAAVAALAAKAASDRALEAAQTLVKNMHYQTNSGMIALQEVSAGDREKYMKVQAVDDQDEDYVDEEPQRSNHTSQQQQQRKRCTPAHKPIPSPQYQQQQQQTPEPRAPQQHQQAPANNADLTATMEEEIRKTVERLRNLQAKDPKLFLKVWSSVRKSDGPEKPPQHGSESFQAQQLPAMENPSMSYGAGPSNQADTHQSHPTQPPNLLAARPPTPKKKPGRKLKNYVEAQTQAQAPVQADQNENHGPQLQNQPPSKQYSGGFAYDIPEEVLASGESSMMQTGDAQELPRKKKINRPLNVERALREMENANLSPQPKRKPSRHKGFKTRPKSVAGEQSQEDVPIEAPPTQMQPAAPRSFGRLLSGPTSADSAVREAHNQPGQQNLQAINGSISNISRMSNMTPASTPNVATSIAQPAQQRIPSGTPQSATPTTLEQAKASRIALSATQTFQDQAAQWPDEHIDLIADTGSKFLNSLPQNAGLTMESKTIRDMLRTNPSYVQVCEMIESERFHMNRSELARTLLSVISPHHPPPAQAQGQQQAVARVQASNAVRANTGERSLSSTAATKRARKEALAADRPVFSQTPTPSSPASDRPYSTHQRQKYGCMESGTRPVEEASFVREGTTQSQAQPKCGPAKPTAAQKGKYTSTSQSPIPEEDDFVPPRADDDENEGYQGQLSLLQTYNKGYRSYKTPRGAQQNGTTSPCVPAQTSVQTTVQGTYVSNGALAPLSQGSHGTSQQKMPNPFESHFSSQNNNRRAPLQDGSPRLSHVISSTTPSYHTLVRKTPLRSWNKSESGQKRPHSEAFTSSRLSGSQTPSPHGPRPWGHRPHSSSEVGARAPNPFGASPSGVDSATPQPQMPTPGTQENVSTLYSTPYLQVNSIGETSNSQQHFFLKNSLLNFDGIILPIDTSVARRRSKYDPKTIARDILRSIGRHPSERPLNGHLELLKEFRAVDNRSDLSTFRWDIIDPGGDEVGYLNKELKERAAASKMPAGNRRGPVPTRGNPFGVITKHRNPSKLPNETFEIEDDGAMDVDNEEMPPSQSIRALEERTQTLGYKPGREESNLAPSYRPMSSTELSELRHDTGRRHRLYHRGPNQTSSEADQETPNREYVMFACKWEKCDHVLANLATLHRHIFIMHGKHDDVVQQGKVCMWHGCGNKDYSAEHDVTPGTYCENLKVFKQHMEDTHLKSVAFLYGDGAKTDVYDNDSNYDSSIHSAFLKDCEGRQVTPTVVDQPVEKGKGSELNNEARMKKLAYEGKRKDRILDFWNIEHFEHQPLKLDARKSIGGLGASCTARFLRAQKELEKEYGVELAKAAKMNEALPEASKKKVYSHDMPKSLREKLFIE